MKMGPGDYDTCMSDLHQHSGVAQMRVLHSVMSRLNNTMRKKYRILESAEDCIKRLTENGDKLQSDEPSS
jgi:hypothetical protein